MLKTGGTNFSGKLLSANLPEKAVKYPILSCLFLLVIIHMYMSKWRKEFEDDINQKSQKIFRYINEVPTALMIIIVIMVIVKPF